MTQDHSCPRCGYDLSGAHAAARTADVPEGICSECGLRFQWSDLESGRLSPPRFSYEHGHALNLRRFFGTFWRALTGWLLWKRLRMEHLVRPMRLVLFVVFTLATVHLLSAATTLLAVRFTNIGWWSPSPMFDNYAIRVQSYGGVGADVLRSVLFTTSSRYQVTVGEVALILIWPYNTQFSVSIYVWHVMTLWLPWPALVGCVLAQIVMAALLLCLRQTRKQYRVRTTHILRGMCMSVPFVLIAYVVLQALASGVVSLQGISPWYTGFEFTFIRPFVAMFLVAQVLWWWGFCRVYLRAQHALGIALAGTILGVLLCFLVGIALDASLLLYLLA